MTWRSCPGYYFLLEWNFLMLPFSPWNSDHQSTSWNSRLVHCRIYFQKNCDCQFVWRSWSKLDGPIQIGRSWSKLDGLGPNWKLIWQKMDAMEQLKKPKLVEMVKLSPIFISRPSTFIDRLVKVFSTFQFDETAENPSLRFILVKRLRNKWISP